MRFTGFNSYEDGEDDLVYVNVEGESGDRTATITFDEAPWTVTISVDGSRDGGTAWLHWGETKTAG